MQRVEKYKTWQLFQQISANTAAVAPADVLVGRHVNTQ